MKLSFFLVFCFAFLTACAAKKVAVNYADTMLEKQVEKRIPLYDEQKQVLAKDIDRFLMENKDEAKEIIHILDKVNPNNPKVLETHYQEFNQQYREIATEFSGIMAKHLAKLDKSQQRKFFENLRLENKDILARSKIERREKIKNRIQQILGTLTKEQQQILKENKKVFDQQVVERVERRSDLHKRFKEILDQELAPESKQKMLLDEFVKYQDKAISSSKNLDIAKAFLPTLTENQKKALKNASGEMQELLNHYIDTVY